MSETRRCAALDQQGKRCRRKAVVYDRYMGAEYYNEHGGTFERMPGWVAVWFCDKHSDPTERDRAR